MHAQRYAVIGTGAIGGFYGAKLQKAGQEIHFLVRSDYEQVKQHGLVIRSKDGDFALPDVHAYNDAAAMPRCDIVIVALKTIHNHILPVILPHVLNEKGIVLLLQNGFGEEARIAEIPGVKQVVAGLCFICSTRVGPGTIHHMDYGYAKFAQYTPDSSPAGITPVMQQIGADFQSAGIDAVMLEDLVQARWQKLVWNIPFSGLTVALNADTLQLVTNPHSRNFAMNCMRDVVAGAAACGKHIPNAFVDEMVRATETMTPYSPSMKLDFEAGRTMELESMYSNPLQAAQQKNVALPYIRTLYDILMFMQSTRCTGEKQR